MDALLSAGLSVQTRSQALGLCQVLMDEGVLAHGEILQEVTGGLPFAGCSSVALYAPCGLKGHNEANLLVLKRLSLISSAGGCSGTPQICY